MILNNYLKPSERWDEMTYNGIYKRDLWKNYLSQKKINTWKEKYNKTEEVKSYDNKFLKITYPDKYQEEVYIFIKDIVIYSYTRFSLVGPGFKYTNIDDEQVNSFYFSDFSYVLDYTRFPIITILSKEEFLKETERIYKFVINNLLNISEK